MLIRRPPLHISGGSFLLRSLWTPTSQQRKEVEEIVARVDQTFDDTKTAFKARKTAELVRALACLQAAKSDFLIQRHDVLLKTLSRLTGRRFHDSLLKSTFYGQFCAGEHERQLPPLIERLGTAGLRPILFYSVESDVAIDNKKTSEQKEEEEEQIERSKVEADENEKRFAASIVAAAQFRDEKKPPWAAIKITALCRPQLLYRVSEALTSPEENSPKSDYTVGKLAEFLADNEGRPFRRNRLSDAELNEFIDAVHRSNRLCQLAADNHVRLLIDAEQTYFQPAIERIAIAGMRINNRSRVWIFNTYQAYLKRTENVLLADLNASKREGWSLGVKLVRGAYMDQERKRAKLLNYRDPVQDSFADTSSTYERCAKNLLDEFALRSGGGIELLVASHNENTVRTMLSELKGRGLSPSLGAVHFAQLYGMADQISYSLGAAGLSAHKLMPYGTIDEVLPYLARRALENGALMEKAQRERRLLARELRRRWLHF